MSDAKPDPLRLVVLGDSTAFTDHTGPQMPAHPQIYPNVVARAIEAAIDRQVTVSVIARPGLEARDVSRMVLKDRHLQFEVLMGADAVIVGVSSFDHAPAGVPPVLEAMVPYLRPAFIRRRARRVLHRIHPFGAALTGSRLSRVPLAEFTKAYDRLLFQVRALTQGAAGVVMGPTSHNSPYYGYKHPERAARERIQFAIAQRHGFPTVASWPLVEPELERLNPDGIHWPTEVHAAVGEALAEPLIAQLKGDLARPPAPRFEAEA